VLRIPGAVTVFAAEPISPELVLVSPPETARVARLLLPDPPAPATASPGAAPRAVVLACAWLFCLLVTLGPLALAVLVSLERSAN
jgi:hypothetical protein